MNNQPDKESLATKEKRMLPFFIEFVKFCSVFAGIVALALLALHAASAAM